MRRKLSWWSLTVLAAPLITPVSAQELGTIAGQIIDQANAITLPGVPVELSGAVRRIEHTDLDGNYRFRVPPGSYQIAIVMGGYAEQHVSVDVVAGETTRVEVSLTSNVFAELPASRPERGVPVDYAWQDLHQKSTNALRRLVDGRGGQRLELRAVEFTGETTAFESFVVHRESVLVVRDEQRVQRRIRLFGSVLQRGDAFTIFSYVVD